MKKALLAAAAAIGLLLSVAPTASATGGLEIKQRDFGCFGIGCEATADMQLYWREQPDGTGVRMDEGVLSGVNDCANFEPNPSMDVTNVWIENRQGVKVWDGANLDVVDTTVTQPDCLSVWLQGAFDGVYIDVGTCSADFRITFKARVDGGDDVTTTMTLTASKC